MRIRLRLPLVLATLAAVAVCYLPLGAQTPQHFVARDVGKPQIEEDK